MDTLLLLNDYFVFDGFSRGCFLPSQLWQMYQAAEIQVLKRTRDKHP